MDNTCSTHAAAACEKTLATAEGQVYEEHDSVEKHCCGSAAGDA